MIIGSCIADYLLVGLLLAFKETRETKRIFRSSIPLEEMSNKDQVLVKEFRKMKNVIPTMDMAFKLFFIMILLFWFPAKAKDLYDNAWDRIFKRR